MKVKAGIIISVLVIVAFTAAVIFSDSAFSSTEHTMQFIKSRMRPNGAFMDYDQSICVSSVDDLGWWKDSDDWCIVYGKLALKCTPKQLKNKSFVKQMNGIGLTVRGDIDEGHLRFYWQDQEISECVPQ